MKTLIICDNKELQYSLEKAARTYGREVICYNWFLKALDNLCEIAPDEVIINCADFPRQWKTLAQYTRSALAMQNSPKVLLYTALLHGRRSDDKTGLIQKEQEKAKFLDVAFYDDIDALFTEVSEVPTVNDLLKNYHNDEITNNSTSVLDILSSTNANNCAPSDFYTVETLLHDLKNDILPNVNNLLQQNLASNGSKLPTVSDLLNGVTSDSLPTVNNLIQNISGNILPTVTNLFNSDIQKSNHISKASSNDIFNAQNNNLQNTSHGELPTVINLLKNANTNILPTVSNLLDGNIKTISGELLTVENIFNPLLQNKTQTYKEILQTNHNNKVNEPFNDAINDHSQSAKEDIKLLSVDDICNDYNDTSAKKCNFNGKLPTVDNLFFGTASQMLFTVANLLTRGDLTNSTTLFTVSNLLSAVSKMPQLPNIILPTVSNLLDAQNNSDEPTAVLYTVANLFAKMPRDMLYTVSNLFEKCATGDMPLYTVANLFTKIAKDYGVDLQLYTVLDLFRGTRYGSLLKKIICDYI